MTDVKLSAELRPKTQIEPKPRAPKEEPKVKEIEEPTAAQDAVRVELQGRSKLPDQKLGSESESSDVPRPREVTA